MFKADEKLKAIEGYVELIFKDQKTGEVLDHSGHNAFLTRGISDIFDLIVEKTLSEGRGNYVIDNIAFGDDVGDGTKSTPEAVVSTDDGSSQSKIYTIPYEDLTINRPNYYTVEYFTSVVGTDIFASYPQEDDLDLTSISLNTFGGYAIAFRRFPVKTATRDVAIDLKWTLKFQV